MKLLIITQEFNNEGGVEKVVNNHIQQLLSIDPTIDIHVITYGGYKNEYDFDITFHPIKRIFPNIHLINISYFFVASRIKYVRLRLKFDIIHKHSSSFIKSDFYTVHSVGVAGFYIINTEQVILQTIKSYILNLRPLPRIIEYRTVVRTKHILSLSSGISKELIQYFCIKKIPITIIPNGIDTSNKYLGPKESNNTLLFVGKEFKRKGLFPLLEVLSLLQQQQIIVNLDVLGYDHINFEGAKQTISRLGLEHQVTLHGHIKDVAQFYKKRSIFVFPTLYEAFAMVTLEAAIYRLAIITCKTNGTEDLITDEVNGLFCTREPRDIADKIQLLIHDQKLVDKLANNIQDHVLQDFSRKKVVGEIYDLYSDTIEKRQKVSSH